ncbi:MAG: hypothetical protein CMM46_05125 [Rhodospirillaceae bacterium]|nr:hypothetical protein [Rhodospirillaceae bacterium]
MLCPQSHGRSPEAESWPTGVDETGKPLACDSLECLCEPPRNRSVIVSIALGTAALSDDCGVADLLISLVSIRRECPAPQGLIDRFDLWRFGTHAIRFDNGSARIETVQQQRGERPWSSAPDQE